VVWSEEKDGGLGPANSADMVITARNIHDWMWFPGQLDKALKDFHAVLKPGGILAVEDHRADPRPQVQDARDGYVNTATLVAAVEKAGFKLEASSEINANPKDTKDYPFGVWTLPPTNATGKLGFMLDWPGLHPDAKLEPEKYKAIGESDRMTLRFRKR
jgi:predicted methyltransferase